MLEQMEQMVVPAFSLNMLSPRTRIYVMYGQFVYPKPMSDDDALDLRREINKHFGKVNTTLAVHTEVLRRVEEKVDKTNGTVGNHDKWITEHSSEMKSVKWAAGIIGSSLAIVVGYLIKIEFGL